MCYCIIKTFGIPYGLAFDMIRGFNISYVTVSRASSRHLKNLSWSVRFSFTLARNATRKFSFYRYLGDEHDEKACCRTAARICYSPMTRWYFSRLLRKFTWLISQAWDLNIEYYIDRPPVFQRKNARDLLVSQLEFFWYNFVTSQINWNKRRRFWMSRRYVYLLVSSFLCFIFSH